MKIETAEDMAAALGGALAHYSAQYPENDWTDFVIDGKNVTFLSGDTALWSFTVEKLPRLEGSKS